jgi:hypothetical protein
MFKILKELKEFKSKRQNFNRFLDKELSLEDFTENESEFKKFKTVRDELDRYLADSDSFKEYEEKKEKFKQFIEWEEPFDSYKNAVGVANRPFFLMYASDIDQEGNVTFSYDFSPEFIQLLKQQGIQGIEDLEVVEAYLHYIFSQNYFSEMLRKEAKKQ